MQTAESKKMTTSKQSKKYDDQQIAEEFYLPGGHQCQGCMSLLSSRIALKTIFQIDRNIVLFGGNCGAGRTPIYSTGLGTNDSTAAALVTALEIRKINKRVVTFSGDGRTIDMGFSDLSGAFSRGYPYLHICLDNQGHASSGGHLTGTTEWRGQTNVHLRGKPTHKKQPAIMMAFSGAVYTATASPAFGDDFRMKLRKGFENMPAFIHVLAPCIPTWGIDPSKALMLARLAVETGLFPLWEQKGGVFRRTVKVGEKKPVEEYLVSQRRFRNLTPEDIQEFRNYIDYLDRILGRLTGEESPSP